MSEIPAEAVQAAAQALQQISCPHTLGWSCARCRARAAVEAAAPFIAEQARREERALVAIGEQGMVIVSAEDLRAVVGETRSYETYTAALPRLRSVLSGTAPQPSESPQCTQTGDGGISGRSDTPNASTGPSAPHAGDLRHRYAEAAKVVHLSWMTTEFEPVGDGRSLPERIADACLAVRDTELEAARRELEAARAGFTAPDDIVYNLVWVAARNEHTRSWLASKGLVVMQREAFDKELADLHRKRGEAEARAEKADAKLAAIDALHPHTELDWWHPCKKHSITDEEATLNACPNCVVETVMGCPRCDDACEYRKILDPDAPEEP